MWYYMNVETLCLRGGHMKDSRKTAIAEYINRFYYEHDKVPSVREIEKGTGIPLATVHRCLISMKEDGELTYNGYRSVRTKEMRCERLRREQGFRWLLFIAA